MPTSTPATTPSDRLDLRIGGCSDKGVKPQNQDAFAAWQADLPVTRYKGVGICLADGVSSSDNAQQASVTSVTHFLQDYYSTPESWDVKSAVSKVMSSLNAWLFHHGQQASARHNGLVTTFSGVIVKSSTAHVFHVGDSRLYHYSDGSLEQVTRDHVQQGGRYLSRALGMDSHLEVDYLQRELKAGDVLLLTSDGVHGHLPTEALRDWIAALPPEASQYQLEQACQRLIQQALANKSEDNLTCVVVQIVSLPRKELGELTREVGSRVIPPVLEPGQKLDRYEVLKVLHANSRSHVYQVRDRFTANLFVLKAPSINFEDDDQYLESFAREQWVGCRLDHPNLMKMLPQQENSQFVYLVSEWLEGVDLRQWSYDHPAMDLATARNMIKPVIAGLRALQRRGMVHRDIKPENILVQPDEQIKIIDYGAVAVKGLTELNSGVIEQRPEGDIQYMAPEYWLDGLATTASDQYSLAVTLYQMLSGELPYNIPLLHRRGAKSATDWHYSSLREHRPDLPLWLDLALKKACHPVASQRYGSFSEFEADLYKPNEQLLRGHERKPLIERAPTSFWQVSTGVLVLLLLLQWWWFRSGSL
jgi:protein phosphatase